MDQARKPEEEENENGNEDSKGKRFEDDIDRLYNPK